MLLEHPAVFGNHPGSGFELGGSGVVAADAFTESGYAEQIVPHGTPALAEVVGDASFDILR